MSDSLFSLFEDEAPPAYSCYSCRLDLKCNTPKIQPTGAGGSCILFIGETVGSLEDKKGEYLCNTDGIYLHNQLQKMNLDMDQQFYYTTALRCHIKAKRPPNTNELLSCREMLLETIKTLKPKIIITLGPIALKTIIGDRARKSRLSFGKYEDWTGEVIPDQDLKTYIIPVHSPSFLRDKEGSEMDRGNPYYLQKWKTHIKKALQIAKQPFYVRDIQSEVHVTTDMKQAIDWLRNEARDRIAFDWETTGIKPQRNGHSIYSMGFSNGLNGFAFPWFDDDSFRIAVLKVLCGPAQLIAHNSPFEALWTKIMAGRWPSSWFWDTMHGAHCLQNKRPTGLKRLGYIHHGVIGYDSGVDDYITKPRNKEEKGHGANGFNNIKEAPLEEVLFYNGMDAHLTYREYEYQEMHLNYEQKKGNQFFLNAGIAFAKIHVNGFRINEKSMQIERKKLYRKMENLSKDILAAPELNEWKGAFNIKSNTQLNKLLYDVLKYPKPEGPATDRAALETIGTPFISNILSYRKKQKMADTYIGQFSREVVRGIIHPFFNLSGSSSYDDGGMAATYRSTSSGPNFQNNPKRDKEQMQTIRGMVIPRPGRKLIEYDNKGNEVKAAACITKDKNLMAHELDDTLDMHRDCAARLFLLDKEEVDKKQHRQMVKNKFVFPEFYGSWWKNIAPDIWGEMDQATMLHIKKKGIDSFSKWEKHVESVENYLWTRFSGYLKWKKQMRRFYNEHGYVDLVTGFRCHGPMDYKQITNYPIQGPAFHIMLWALTKIVDELRNRKMETLCIGQIHDSMMFDCVPDEEDALDKIVYQYGVKRVTEYWDWITIPPVIEKEASLVDGSWAVMEDMGYLCK